MSHTNIFLDVGECKAGLDSCPENAQCKNTIDLFHNDVKRGKIELTWNLIGSRFFSSQSNFM